MFPFLLFLLFFAPGWILNKKRKESFFCSSPPSSLHFFLPAFCKLPPLCVHMLCTVVSTALQPHARWPARLCNLMHSGPPGSSVHGIPQARILEWVAIPFSSRSPQHRNQIHISCVSCISWWVVYLLSHWGSLSTTLLKYHFLKLFFLI